MGAVLAALATVTAQWLPNWNRGFNRVQRTELFAIGLERIVADLSAIEFVAPNRETKGPLFEGTALSVTFVRTAVGPNSRPGLEIVRIAETADEHGPVMIRMRSPFAPIAPGVRPEDQAPFADPVILVRSPYRLSYSYAGQDHKWQDRWLDSAQLPSAIRLNVRDAVTEDTLAVSTVAMVRAQIPVDCVTNTALAVIDCGEPRVQRSPQPVAGPAPQSPPSTNNVNPPIR
jgi:general secretion pathway protein J